MAAWVRRRQGPDALPLRLHRRRIYILPTRSGLGFSALLLVMLLAGLNYQNSLALLLVFLLTGFVLVVLQQCHRNLLDVRLTDADCRPAFAGERGALALLLTNPSPMARYALELELPGKSRVGTDLAADSSARAELAVATGARGVLRLDRLKLSSTYPFGLFRAWAWVHAPFELLVYPRPNGVRPLPELPGESSGLARRRASPHDEDEWCGLRPLRAGDSPRQVAWKAYARGAPLMVKEYAASAARRRWLDFSQLAGLDTERRLEQLARWVLEADARGEAYALVLPDRQLDAGRGLRHRSRALAVLALHGLPGEPPA